MTSEIKSTLSLTQRDIYLDQLRHSGCALYNVGGYIDIPSIDVPRITRAHAKIISRHPAFGTRIVSTEEGLHKYVSEVRNTNLETVDFSRQDDSVAAAGRWVTELFETPINCHNSELFRAFLLKISKTRYWYIGLCHHLAMDGWGFANWAEKLAEYYRNDEGENIEVPHCEDVTEDDNGYLFEKRYQKDKAFWSEYCWDLPEKLLVAHYKNRFSEKSNVPSKRHVIKFPRATFTRLMQHAEEMHVAAAPFFLGIVAIYFHRAYSRNRISIGIPLHNRRNHAQKKSIGVFTNINPLVLSIEHSQSFRDVARHVMTELNKIYRHQRYPVGEIVRELRLGDGGHSLYDVIFNYLKLDNRNLLFDDSFGTLVYRSNNYEQTPLTFTVWDCGEDEMEIQLDYNLAYFEDVEIEMLANRISLLLDSIGDWNDIPVGEIDILPVPEKQHLRDLGSSTSASAYRSIVGMIEKQIRDSPEAIAATIEERSFSYADLEQASCQIARLLQSRGAKPGDLIAIQLRPSLNMLAAIVGIWKIGCAYLPLDYRMPKDRLRYIFDDAGFQYLLVDSLNSETLNEPSIKVTSINLNAMRFESSTSEVLEDILPVPNPADQPAYVIYTSGSTGTPKGVVVSFGALGSHIQTVTKILDINSSDNVLQVTNYSFDTFIEQTFAALSVGASLHFVAGDLPDTEGFFQIVCEKNISITDLPVGYFSQILEQCDASDWLNSKLSRVVVGGEALARSVVRTWCKKSIGSRCKLYNAYGPTEAVITATLREINGEDCSVVRIGRPVGDRQVFVVDNHSSIVPFGIPGELMIGGKCIAQGYLNNRELTRKQFVPSIHGARGSSRLYRTGDIVRYLPDGDLEFIGRLDEQVNIRGYRIELAEIEFQLTQVAGVRSSVVRTFTGPSGDMLLAAYLLLDEKKVLSADRAKFKAEIRSTLQNKLPSYMSPSAFIFVDKWPLLTSGKIDKNALPAPNNDDVLSKHHPPETETERELAEIWAMLLKVEVDKINVLASFFELGGHSLLAIRLLTEIKRKFGLTLDIQMIFDKYNIRALANTIQMVNDKLQLSRKLEQLDGEQIEEVEF